MSVTLSNLTTKIRNLIEDDLEDGVYIDTYKTSDVFTLDEENISEVSTLYVNDVDYGDSNWEYSSGKVTLTVNDGISTGDTIKIEYTYYPNYSDTQIQNRIKSALIHISVNNYKEFIVEESNIYPEPDESEKNLICLVTATLISPNNNTVRLPDLTINVPNDLPTDKKVSRIIALYKKDGHGILESI